MEKLLRMEIVIDPDANGVEVKKRGGDRFEVKIEESLDLKNDKHVAEAFVQSLNETLTEEFEQAPLIDLAKNRHRIEVWRLNDAIQRGKQQYSFRLHSH